MFFLSAHPYRTDHRWRTEVAEERTEASLEGAHPPAAACKQAPPCLFGVRESRAFGRQQQDTRRDNRRIDSANGSPGMHGKRKERRSLSSILRRPYRMTAGERRSDNHQSYFKQLPHPALPDSYDQAEDEPSLFSVERLHRSLLFSLAFPVVPHTSGRKEPPRRQAAARNTIVQHAYPCRRTRLPNQDIHTYVCLYISGAGRKRAERTHDRGHSSNKNSQLDSRRLPGSSPLTPYTLSLPH